MDGLRFDRIVRLWGRRASRREALRALGGAGMGAVLGVLGTRKVAAYDGELRACGLTCPAGQVCAAGDFGPLDESPGSTTCCPPELIFRTHQFDAETRFCCPADQVCANPADPSGWTAQCCYAHEACVAGECCEGGDVCGGRCCRDTVCIDGACVCPSGVVCGGACCPAGENASDLPFCGTDELGLPTACCYAVADSAGGGVSCVAAGGGGFGRFRP